jgi:hypothetical protein
MSTASTVSGGPGCRKLVRQGAADDANFVKLDGTTYTADRPMVGRALGDGDLGPVHARVRCSLRDKMDPSRKEPQDGDAAYLEAGSPLYQVHGYRPTFRLAARQDGRLVIFEADTNPRARAGRDLLDLEGKVRRIGINSRADGTTELGAITDPEQVAAMVRMLLAGPVDQRVQPAASSPCGCWPFTCWMAPRRSASTILATGASSRASWSPGGSGSWSRPPPPKRPSGRSGRGAGSSRGSDAKMSSAKASRRPRILASSAAVRPPTACSLVLGPGRDESSHPICHRRPDRVLVSGEARPHPPAAQPRRAVARPGW